MLNLEKLKIASLDASQIQKLKEAEEAINATGTREIYLLALTRES